MHPHETLQHPISHNFNFHDNANIIKFKLTLTCYPISFTKFQHGRGTSEFSTNQLIFTCQHDRAEMPTSLIKLSNLLTDSLTYI